MKAYIEEEAWASCTFDLAGSPQQLIKLSDRRVVGYTPQDRLLTIDDRATKEKFSCKLIAKQWGGLLALAGGIAIGAALVLSGPVGWIALGAVAVVAIGTTVAVCIHDCSDPLKNGQWIQFHTTVLIQGKNTVLYNYSQLNCGNGGIVVASTTQAAAQELSDAMKWNARIELGVQILSNGLIGLIVGYGLIDDGGADTDLATVPLAISSYVYTDFFHPEYTPEQSLVAGLVFSGIGYGLPLVSKIPGLGGLAGKIGTELSLQDLGVTALVAAVGYSGDKLEQYLANWNVDIVKGATAQSSSASGKTIICTEY